MKVSRREFILLFILLGIGLIYVLYTFLYAPMLRDIGEASLTLLERQAALTQYETTIAQYDLDEMAANQEALIAQTEEAAMPLLPDVDYSELTAFVDGIALSQDVEVYTMSVAGEELYDTIPAGAEKPVTFPLQQSAERFRSRNDAETPDPTSNAAIVGQAESTAVVNRISVEITLENVTYSQILGFIKELESYKRAIYMESLEISDEAGANLAAKLVYGFMQADKLTDTDKGLSEVLPADNTGKQDPFSGGVGTVTQPETPIDNENQQ